MIGTLVCFDTVLDTKKISVSIKYKFHVREYVRADGKSPVQLHVNMAGFKRERESLPIAVDKSLWNHEKQVLFEADDFCKGINLYLKTIESKITSIQVQFLLSQRILTPAALVHELNSDMPRVKFCTFFDHVLKEEKSEMKPGTYRRHTSVLAKLKEYNPDLLFTDLTSSWFKKYRSYLASKKDNKSTTIAANIASIKKVLRVAEKSGIKLLIDLDDLVPGSTKGNQTFLNPNELKRVSKYFFSEFINPSHKLTLGYFLFGCFSGLRISDIQALERYDILDGEISFNAIKTGRGQLISMNNKAIEYVKHHPDLFIKKYKDQTHNDTLKDVMKFLGINKKVTFHVSRHTFATNFLRVGGKVEFLQKLLGHKKIETTMVYVHILAAEANKEIFRLDDLF